MTKLKRLGLSLVAISVLSLSGCGSDTAGTTPTDITVERGAVYDSNVSDSAGNIATQKVGLNIYTFADTPVYPITVTGGWIDVDSDGKHTASDVELTVPMSSYSNVVTPITTYIANPDESIREQRLAKLVKTTGVSQSDLLKVPSKASVNSMLVNNAIYKQIVISDGTQEIKIDEIKKDFNNFHILVSQREDKTGAALVTLVEEEVVSELVDLGKLEFNEELVLKPTTKKPINMDPIAYTIIDTNESVASTSTVTVKEHSNISQIAEASTSTPPAVEKFIEITQPVEESIAITEPVTSTSTVTVKEHSNISQTGEASTNTPPAVEASTVVTSPVNESVTTTEPADTHTEPMATTDKPTIIAPPATPVTIF